MSTSILQLRTLEDYDRKAKRGILIGLSLVPAAYLLGLSLFPVGYCANPLDPMRPLYLITYPIVVVFLVWGSVNLANRKGYPGVTALLALLVWVGIPILLLLPDRNRDQTGVDFHIIRTCFS